MRRRFPMSQLGTSAGSVRTMRLFTVSITNLSGFILIFCGDSSTCSKSISMYFFSSWLHSFPRTNALNIESAPRDFEVFGAASLGDPFVLVIFIFCLSVCMNVMYTVCMYVYIVLNILLGNEDLRPFSG